jgi:hypothetical protein
LRPAGNVQLATTTDAARAIVGVSVTNRGSDQGQATPCSNRSRPAPALRPTELLVDGGCPSLVISFADVPRVRDRTAASQLPQLAVLSVLAHPELETAEIAIEAIAQLPEDLLRLYKLTSS